MTRDFTHRMKIAGTETAFEVLALATQLEAKGKSMEEANLEDMNKIWEKIKENENIQCE